MGDFRRWCISYAVTFFLLTLLWRAFALPGEMPIEDFGRVIGLAVFVACVCVAAFGRKDTPA